MRVIYYLILLLVLLAALQASIVVGELRYSRVFLFDIDGDGVLEVVSDIGFVRGEALVPFSRSLDVYRFQCDTDLKCLLLLDRGVGVSRVYVPGRFLAEFSVDGTIGFSNYPYNVMAVGSKVYWGGLWFKASLDPVGLKAFLDNGRLMLAYIDRFSGYVVVESPGYLPPIRIMPFNGSIAGVGSYDGLVLLLLSSPTGSALIEWGLGGVFKATLYNVVLEEAVAFVDGAFIANGERGVYLIRRDGLTLLLEGYRALKIGLGGEVLLKGLGRVLVAEARGDGLRALREVTVGNIVDVDYGNGVLVYTDGLKVNTIKYFFETPVELSIPPNAIAREPVVVAIIGDFRAAYVNLPDLSVIRLTPENPRYVWRPSIPGSYVVTAIVDVGGSTVHLSKPITIAPRPATLTIRVESPAVKPYSSVNVVLEVRDGITGESLRDVLGVCTVEVPGNSFPARPWTPIVVPSIPVGVEVPIVAFCPLPQPYGEARASLTLRVNETYVKVEPLYLGGGVLRLHAYNMYTGEPVNGILRVTIGGNTTTVGVGGEIRLPRPGLWNVRWELLQGNIVLNSGSTTISYYERIEVAPLVATIAVADRFITITTTQTTTEEVPVVRTIEVTKIDPLIAMLSFIAGIALAGTPLVIILIRRAGAPE